MDKTRGTVNMRAPQTGRPLTTTQMMMATKTDVVQTKDGAKRVLSMGELGTALHVAFNAQRAKGLTEPAVIAREAAASVEKQLLPDHKPGWFLVDGYSITMIGYQTSPPRVFIRACSGANGKVLRRRFAVEGTPGLLLDDPTPASPMSDDDP